uniref:Uncharacterized protein n=1 Tax=Caenorhabditis japonica TaxID=281687 RepID=A0A8R1HTU3_CAEJA
MGCVVPNAIKCTPSRIHSNHTLAHTQKAPKMPSAALSPLQHSLSSSSEDDKHTDADVTPKASPSNSEAEDDNDKTLTMPSTSHGFKADSSPVHAHSVPSSQEATSPPAARRVETPAAPEPEFYYFTTDMANQAALDIEREKEKFDSLVTWYKVTKEDVPQLGTSSLGNSAAPSYVSEKESTTPMSSQPSSHQSGLSGGAHGGLNGFSYSPFGLDNPSSNDPLDPLCRGTSPVNLDEICPTLEDFMTGLAPSTSSGAPGAPQPPQLTPMTSQNTYHNINPHSIGSNSSMHASPMPGQNLQNQNPMMNPSPMAPILQSHLMHQSPLNPLSMNHQTPTSSVAGNYSNPPSNQGLKRKRDEDEAPGSAKQMRLEGSAAAPPRDEGPMRRLEMMANSQNFLAGNTINDVVEGTKKDERALKMEKLEGIEKSVEEEMAQQAREAHMKRMQAAAAAQAQAAQAQGYPSPGQFPPGMPYPGMPPHPGMPGGGPPFSAGASFPPMGGPYPPYGQHPMYPGITPGGYPMSAPGKMPFGSPNFPGAPSPAMAAMQAQQAQAAMQAQQAQAAQQAAASRMPPHPSMMTPQQQAHFAYMHHMAQMQKAAAASMSPSMMKNSPSPFPPGHPAHQNPAMFHHHQMMMMRHAQMQAQAAGSSAGAGAPFGFPPGMPMPPMHPGMHPGMAGMPPGMLPGMPPMDPRAQQQQQHQQMQQQQQQQMAAGNREFFI